MSQQSLRVCTLLCDDTGPDFSPNGDYSQLFHDWLSLSVKTHPADSVRDAIEIAMTTYHVWEGQWPNLEDFGIDGCFDAIIITGGKGASYDPSPWIVQAKQFLRDVVYSPNSQHIKIFGSCLGHQIIAEAFGGHVAAGSKVELGVYDVQLTELGQRWWKGREGNVRIQQFHRDEVTKLPPNFELLASTVDCHCHSMIKYTDDQPGRESVGQVITMQGHPEVTKDITAFLMDVRLKSEVLSEIEIAEAWKRVDGVSGTGGADEDIVGWALLDFMLGD